MQEELEDRVRARLLRELEEFGLARLDLRLDDRGPAPSVFAFARLHDGTFAAARVYEDDLADGELRLVFVSPGDLALVFEVLATAGLRPTLG